MVIVVLIGTAVIGSLRIRGSKRPPYFSDSGLRMPTATRIIPWMVVPGLYIKISTLEPGVTPQPYLVLPEQAREQALAMLGVTNPVRTIVKRTSRSQIKALFLAQRGAFPGYPTPTLPSVDADNSPVTWVVVVQSAAPLSQNAAWRAMQFPLFSPRPSPSANATDAMDAYDTFGHFICVVMDELGNPSQVQLLDYIDPSNDFSPPRPDPAAIAALPDVGPSFTPTPVR